MKISSLALAVGLGLSAVALPASFQPVMAKDIVDPALYKAMNWRFVGPYRGGRAVTAVGVKGDPMTYYMGTTGGGVWKTTNAGMTWDNISDEHFNVGTIGAIAVAESDPNVLYVGTGESPIRGVTTSHGDGVYKSTDGGKTWTHMGLKDTRQISRIHVDPTNPDIVYVAAQGNIWGPNDDRGIYKSVDGGKTWKQTLFTNGQSGAADLSMDPTNPRIMYAAMWHHGRKPWYMLSGGEGGGIYKTTDSGETWQKLGGGLPGLVGKIGVKVSPSNPDIVYAVVEAEEGKGGIYRSNNGGRTWSHVNKQRIIQARAWYYNHISVDPNDENTLYILNAPILKSIDGGKTFVNMAKDGMAPPHGDHHDQWINPDNSLNMINANDGGGSITFDGGKTWSPNTNQPTAQFYRVITDNQFPYRIYGGQQDNSTVSIASETFDGGIGREDFFPVGGGESAHIAFDENNPELIYATTINGTLTEYNSKTQEMRPIKPYPEYVFGRNPKDHKYRTNWNAPVITSPHDPSVIYYGTHKLLKSMDRGVTWAEISGDLTRNDKAKQGQNGGPLTNEQAGAEFYNTIFYIVESQHEKGTIWIGSDDGLVHITRDEGGSWDNVTPKGLKETQINAIEVSPHNPAKAYLAVTGYKMNDFKPYIYVTENYGRTWKRLDKGLPEDTFVRVVREDPVREGLLYAGTEAGMFVSFDAGKNWQSLEQNLPPVPITDLTIRQGDLVAATQGRGFWVMDNLSPLRQIQVGDSKEDLKLYQPIDTAQVAGGGGGGEFNGRNPTRGLEIFYYLDEDLSSPLSIEILNADDQVVRTYSSEEREIDRCILSNMDQRSPFSLSYPSTKKGLNRWVWNFGRNELNCVFDITMFHGFGGARVQPGDYKVRVSFGDESQIQSFSVLPDPRSSATPDQYAALEARIVEVTDLMNELLDGIGSMRDAREQVKALIKAQSDDEVIAAANAAVSAIDAWEQSVRQVKYETFEDDLTWPNLLDVQIKHLLDSIARAGVPVTRGALDRLADLKGQWADRKAAMNAVKGGEIAALNQLMATKGIAHVPVR